MHKKINSHVDKANKKNERVQTGLQYFFEFSEITLNNKI
jgi:hypothetical protein